MKNINILFIISALLLNFNLFALELDNNTSISQDENMTLNIVDDSNNTQALVITPFESLFVNHMAYLYYNKGIQALYKGDYKTAYNFAMKAQAITDNTEQEKDLTIALPYLPNYVRESAYAPKRIYYKIIKYKPYELKRLITKTKLISPPIATISLNRTSTYISMHIKNFGDLPLDNFEVLLNDKLIAKYDKILVGEDKIIRINKAPILYEISFKEKYGFAPQNITLSEDQ